MRVTREWSLRASRTGSAAADRWMTEWLQWWITVDRMADQLCHRPLQVIGVKKITSELKKNIKNMLLTWNRYIKTQAFNCESTTVRSKAASSRSESLSVSESKHWHTVVKTGKYWMIHTKEKTQRKLLLMRTAAYFHFLKNIRQLKNIKTCLWTSIKIILIGLRN